ncbi:response regulator transcription factor [Pedobacter sp. MC2016-14]|uniref:response regulator transcription factor n=1 Tax=Pedobacter sp. MC2016-14 TaxID=2897327 RepID=UPI001E5AB591|nr:response regulator transcription factor [Pedobacter sp. MC2016-14]MCD0486934.1 response regulator transcription factor [Pedobacter sp. MC2016-14]
MLNVILAEDHIVMRNGLKMLLEMDGKIQVIAEASGGREVLNLAAQLPKIDFVISDISMPDMDGIEMLKLLKQSRPEVKVIILSMLDVEKYIIEAFSAGVSGYLLKSVSTAELLFAIEHVHSGGTYLCTGLSKNLLDKLIENSKIKTFRAGQDLNFSKRDKEVLRMLANGLTTSEMADQLFVSSRTIDGYRQSLLEKTGTRNTTSLIWYAAVNGLISV